MHIIKITVLSFFCYILNVGFSKGQQNDVWSLPPNFINSNQNLIPQPLPTGPTILQYNGSPAQYTHNAMVSAQGDLLFFIVDGYVYDNTGYLIEAIGGLPGSFTTFSSSSGANQPLHRFSLDTAL